MPSLGHDVFNVKVCRNPLTFGPRRVQMLFDPREHHPQSSPREPLIERCRDKFLAEFLIVRPQPPSRSLLG